MIPQQKLLRIMKLVSLLKARNRKTPKELAQILDTSDKSIYRYFNLLEDVGFAIDKDMQNRYFIQVWDEQEQDLAFSTEESALLKGMIASLKNHPLRESLLEKIYIKSDTAGIAHNIYKAGLSKMVNQLQEAMDQQKQVVIKKYQSANSDSITDRMVEPFAFSDNYQYVIAYELESKSSKHFKLERIGKIDIVNKTQKHTKNHSRPQADLFGMAEGEETPVKLQLNMRAALLLREEYPKAEPFLEQEGDKFYLKCSVKGFRGIGRFILSNLGEIKVMEPNELKKFIYSKIEEGKKFL